jgi:hypothetical protein
MQPFNRSGATDDDKQVIDGLLTLHDWARIDRHRRLHVVGSWASEARPGLVLPPGITLREMKLTQRAGQFLETESEIATFALEGWKPGMTIAANPKLFIDIAVSESSAIGTNPTLSAATNAVKLSVEIIWRRFKNSY